ncbi:uncharacterized protein PFLUO_LOCUS7192 [Penicillium psychrofluorescens]|uniref:uncharacterized protein n=1 Tax=Penicillium psychrofluorescens TaxID=3158075 RepID=UPI003CCD5615
MPTNRAAWQDEAGIKLSIRSTAYETEVAANQILVKVQAWAINPCDHMLQDVALPFVKYPVILGEDIAGTVVSTGSSAATRFRPDDCVLAFAKGTTGGPTMGGFQEYVIVDADTASPIPKWISFAEASVFPLAIYSSAHALFSSQMLGLPLPRVGKTESDSGKYLLVWGGSSVLGSNAIQMARAAELDVLSTASERNFVHVKKLGANKVFDYSSESVVDDIVAELDSRDPGLCVGIFHAAGNVEPCLQIAAKTKGSPFVVSSGPVPEDKVPSGVRAKMVFGDQDDIVCKIYGDFLPRALAERRYVVAPEPLIIQTKGLEGIQEGYEVLKKGVSARKVVVEAE